MLCSWGLGLIQICGIVQSLSGQPTVEADGYYSTCACSSSGVLKCWGSGGNGRLGQGDTTPRGGDPTDMGDALPAVELGSGRSCVDAAVGNNHACALLDDGNMKCWGDNAQGQLGYGDTSTRGNSPCQMGDHLPNVDLNGETGLQLTAGTYFTCVILTGGG
eukprot:3964870-Amphidinium_carterae.1